MRRSVLVFVLAFTTGCAFARAGATPGTAELGGLMVAPKRATGGYAMSHHHQLDSEEGRRLLEAVRAVCARLPQVEEVIDGFGHTTFRVGRKSFVIAGMGERGESISIKADPVTQAMLVRRAPYYRTPYIGQHGWVSIANPLEHDWPHVRALIVDAYRLAAPKRLVKSIPPDVAGGPPGEEGEPRGVGE